MKIIKYIPLLLLNFSCSAQTNLEKYIIDDDGITVEKTDSTKQYDDVYNTNNIIYKVGKKCVFTVTQLVDQDKFIKVLQNVTTFLWKTDNFNKFIKRKPLKF